MRRVVGQHRLAVGVLIALSTMLLSGCGPRPLDSARTLMDQGLYRQAATLLEQEVLKHPKNTDAMLLLGYCEANRALAEPDQSAARVEHAQAAEEMFQACSRIKPKFADPYLGSLFLKFCTTEDPRAVLARISSEDRSRYRSDRGFLLFFNRLLVASGSPPESAYVDLLRYSRPSGPWLSEAPGRGSPLYYGSRFVVWVDSAAAVKEPRGSAVRTLPAGTSAVITGMESGWLCYDDPTVPRWVREPGWSLGWNTVDQGLLRANILGDALPQFWLSDVLLYHRGQILEDGQHDPAQAQAVARPQTSNDWPGRGSSIAQKMSFLVRRPTPLWVRESDVMRGAETPEQDAAKVAILRQARVVWGDSAATAIKEAKLAKGIDAVCAALFCGEPMRPRAGNVRFTERGIEETYESDLSAVRLRGGILEDIKVVGAK